ncbi:hypothetical protein ACU4GD_34550 [Cupriavidus basilensis]
MPVISIDYCPPADRKCARDTAARIRALDIIPYVADPGLQTVGIGSIEVMPRRAGGAGPRPGRAGRSFPGRAFRGDAAELPGLSRGLRRSQRAVARGRPGSLRRRGDLAGGARDQPMRFANWVQKLIEQGVPVVFMNDFGGPLAARWRPP